MKFSLVALAVLPLAAAASLRQPGSIDTVGNPTPNADAPLDQPGYGDTGNPTPDDADAPLDHPEPVGKTPPNAGAPLDQPEPIGTVGKTLPDASLDQPGPEPIGTVGNSTTGELARGGSYHNKIFPYYMVFHYSNNLVKTGDQDLFPTIWEKGFANADETGVQTDDFYNVFGFRIRCAYNDLKPDLRVNVKLKGTWGIVSGINGWHVRTQLIHSMWDLAQKAMVEDDDPVWKKCLSCSLGGCSDNPQAACGQFRPAKCDCDKNFGGGNIGSAICFEKRTTHKIPSQMTLAIYNADGTLRADSLEVEVSSQEIPNPRKGCGKLGAFAEVALNIIPEFGGYLSDQVKIACRYA